MTAIIASGSSSSRATRSAANSAVPEEPGENSLDLGEPASGHERVPVAHGDVAVDHRGVEGLGPKVLADALDQVGAGLAAGVPRSHRVGPDALDRIVLFLQVPPAAGDRPAGADPGDEMGQAATRLPP